MGRGRIVSGGEHVGLAVISEGAVFMAELLAGLAQQAWQERIALRAGTLHRLNEFDLGEFQVASVKRDVPYEVGEITFLLFCHFGVAVEMSACGGDLALSFDFIATPSGDAS